MASPPTGAVYAIQASATTGNVNGAGFNPTATYFNTDLATDANTANTASPVVSSASYNFVAGDVGDYVYVKSGTHWQAGWYPIASVASNKATLNAAVGAVVLSINAIGTVTLNTVAGCTSDNTATLTAGTYGVDYSQADTAMATSTTATSSGAGSVILFAGSAQSMLGNYVQIISGTNATAGWYEIIAESTGVSITTDRASTTGIGASITMNIGGAGRMNGAEDAFQAMLPAASIILVKNGTYTFSGAISTANANNTTTNPSFWIGYNSIRGDACNGANRPIFAAGANVVTFGVNQLLRNISFTTTAAGGISGSSPVVNCKFFNSSSTVGRIAAGIATVIDSEIISQNGDGISSGVIVTTIGSYIHDSARGVVHSSTNMIVAINNIVAGCSTSAFNNSGGTAGNTIIGNTIYGREAKIGTGINFSAANEPAARIINNILYGLTTGINIGTGNANNNFSYYNDFFNNTTDVTNFLKNPTDIAVNPTFTGASQLTGTTANTSGSVLTDSGANFSTVVDNVSFLHVTSGTGVTTGCYLITSHTTTTLTVNNALGTSSSNNDVYWVSIGNNFQIGSNLKAQGFPSFTNSTGGQTTSYPDIGAVQIQATGGTSGGAFTFVG